MSPELIRGGNEGHDFSVDWWSVGVLTYELLTGASPFTVDGERNTQAEISKRILKNQPPIPDHLSDAARDFILRLLVKDPSKRLGGGQSDASQLKSHPFLATINWNLLAQRKLKAPFKPKIKHELDVSNFADEFTSMVPHILVSSSSNQISTTNQNQSSLSSSSSPSVEESEEDDFYESSDDDNENEPNNISTSLYDDSSDQYFYDDNDDDDSSDICKMKSKANIISNNYRQFQSVTLDTTSHASYYDNNCLHNDNARHHSKNTTTRNELLVLNEENGTKKMNISLSKPTSNVSVIMTTEEDSHDNNNHFGCASNNDKNIDKGKLNKYGDGDCDDSHDMGTNVACQTNDMTTTITDKQQQQQQRANLNGGQNAPENNDSSSTKQTAASNTSAMIQQYHNGVHFSRLFKGYSYINPKAMEWLKQQEVKESNKMKSNNNSNNNNDNINKSISRVRNSLKLANLYDQNQANSNNNNNGLNSTDLNNLNDNRNLIRHPKQNNSTINDNELILEPLVACKNVRAAKAVPMESNLMILDDDDDHDHFFHHNHEFVCHEEAFTRYNMTTMKSLSEGINSPVAFTIGDGEDLASAIRSADDANRPTPERLVVAKRKPSLELFYERYANNHQAKPATMTTSSRLGSIQHDPQCDFFKVYHLIHPLNSRRDLLGEGAYSICKRCVHKETGKEYAVKIMRRSQETSREVEMLHRCQGHPNIVRLYNVFHDQFNTYLVCELLKGGELLARVQKRRRLMTEQEVCRLFKSLVSSVYYLHSQRIVHRDLKLENLLLVDSSPSSDIKLIDFGFARELPESDSGVSMHSPCVTLDYGAPEVLNQVIISSNTSTTAPNPALDRTTSTSSSELSTSLGHYAGGYDESCDLWSMGVILYTMFTGRLPFGSATRAWLNHQRPVELSGPEWDLIGEMPKSIIRGLLEPDPSKRLTIEQLSQNEWIMTNFDHMTDVGQETTPKRKRTMADSGQADNKTTSCRSASSACKKASPTSAPRNKTITMTLRKRAMIKVGSDEGRVLPHPTTTCLDEARPADSTSSSSSSPSSGTLKKKFKRSLDNSVTLCQDALSTDTNIAHSDDLGARKQSTHSGRHHHHHHHRRNKKLKLSEDMDSRQQQQHHNQDQATNQLDGNNWMSRFVEVDQPDKSNLRVTFKAYYYYYCC